MIYENNQFNPTDLDLSRSTFHMSPTSSGTMNAGRLIPVRTFWVQPGDTMKMDVKSLIKMSTPVYPTMDALFAQIDFFFVPFKLLLSRRYGSPSVNDASESWEGIIGAQDFLLNMPTPANGVTIPTFTVHINSGYKPGNLMDYFPVFYSGNNNLELSALPILAYFSIWNENYRDPNLMTPVTWSFGTGSNGRKYISPSGMVPLYATREELKYRNSIATDPDYQLVNALGTGKTWTPATPDTSAYADDWLPFPVCRFHGYFGSGLPWPQRNTEGVKLPLGDSAPILTSGASSGSLFGQNYGLKWVPVGGSQNVVTSTPAIGLDSAGNTGPTDAGSSGIGVPSGNAAIAPGNLIADLKQATAANVNALRASIQLQRWYEKLARSGNRYDELEYGTFGVRPHDSGDNRPLYLGGKRISLAIEMVASTNGDTSASSGQGSGSLGALGAFSHTNDEDGYFYHSFDDWGVVMCMVSIRHHDTFGSGTDRHWMKKSREDLYFPTFAHLGEQGTDDAELIDKASTGRVLSYMPAWSEYRNELDRVHGLLRPGQSLQFMTYARSYGANTTLSEFLNASAQVATVDQTLAVSSNASGFQFVYQFTFDISWRRCMPTDSIPGLMDHF